MGRETDDPALCVHDLCILFPHNSCFHLKFRQIEDSRDVDAISRPQQHTSRVPLAQSQQSSESGSGIVWGQLSLANPAGQVQQSGRCSGYIIRRERRGQRNNARERGGGCGVDVYATGWWRRNGRCLCRSGQRWAAGELGETSLNLARWRFLVLAPEREMKGARIMSVLLFVSSTVESC